MSRLKPGDRLNRWTWQNLQGQPVHLPDVTTPLVHLQFRRFAGCPICNLHLRQMAARLDELRHAGVHEIAFFHSSAAAMQPYQGDLPFDCIADPEMTVYRQFGVEVSWRGLLDPRNLPAVFNGIVGRFPKHLFAGGEAGHAGMPADFLIDARGVIVDAHYGRFADDQWTVDDVLGRAHRRLDRAV